MPYEPIQFRQRALPRRSRPLIAFTLVELMISIALVLVLMVGISRVFTITSQTVGTSQAFSEVYRSARAAQAVLHKDFADIADGSVTPFLMITSGMQVAYANQKDELADRDKNKLTLDLDNDAVEGNSLGENVTATVYDGRNHRVDTMAFFVRSTQRRQTGDGVASLVSDMTSQEAYVWLGHLWQPNNDTSADPNTTLKYFTDPPTNAVPTYPGLGAASTNPNNYYAQDWILGRQVILLKDSASYTAAAGGEFALTSALAVPFQFGPRIDYTSSPATVSYIPDPPPTGRPDPNATALATSRYDVAVGTLGGVRGAVAPAMLSTLYYADTAGAAPLVGRFQGTDFFLKPLDDATGSAKLAKTVPVFVPGCSQFIVEFAGDYVDQRSGVAVAGQDGEIDYVIVNNQRQTQWYGMPRDTNGDGVITVGSGDVVPVSSTIAGVQPFERVNVSLSPNFDSKYVCVWTAAEAASTTLYPRGQFPRMFRLTLVVDDPSGLGRLSDSQNFEYVFTP